MWNQKELKLKCTKCKTDKHMTITVHGPRKGSLHCQKCHDHYTHPLLKEFLEAGEEIGAEAAREAIRQALGVVSKSDFERAEGETEDAFNEVRNDIHRLS